jgi:alpha-galactosidase
MPDVEPALIHWRGCGVSVLIDCQGDGLPRIPYWGADLGPLADEDLVSVSLAGLPQQGSNQPDARVEVSVLPEQSRGWMGTPGLSGHRDAGAWSPRFVTRSRDLTLPWAGAEALPVHRLRVTAEDPDLGLDCLWELEMTQSGLLRQRATITNTGADGFRLECLLPTFPLPPQATELCDLTGRHLRERSPQRSPFTQGSHTRENRRGRTGLDASLLLFAGTSGFGFESGDVWATHLAWSGNHRLVAERDNTGVSWLGGGELLMPGEARLARGESYSSPWLYGSWGRGINELSGRFHAYLRARPMHPDSPRPVTLNTWEAVYFEHDLGRLSALADAGAEVGVERFVLDDGWFGGRRSDRAGLGDWVVSPQAWPGGLEPLISHVTGLGMEFGIWVEPEMVNPDSDLARAHPDWVMTADAHRAPMTARGQQTLNLAIPEAYDHILTQLDALLGDHDISYLKWDHNRDLHEAGDSRTGRPSVHAQTLATYALMDELQQRHPGVEIESCSSGGGRVDLAILERTHRVWASDCIDALERQQIQRWTAALIPWELIGCHVGSGVAHTTGRQHVLDFRAGTAFFGHFGVEWDLSTASQSDRTRLAAWITAHKRFRRLLHTGRVVVSDHPDPALWVHGVVAHDGTEAVYSLAQVATGVASPAGRVRLPGLDPEAVYDVLPLFPGDDTSAADQSSLPWWSPGIRLKGSVLGSMGVQAPNLLPERLVLLVATRVGGDGS